MKIVDLTYLIEEEMPVFPGTEKPILQEIESLRELGFREIKMTMYSHTGTHVDAPAHMFFDELTLDRMPVDSFVGKAMIIDCSNLGGAGQEIQLADIERYRDDIVTNAVEFVIIKTGWSRYWGKEDYYRGFPHLSERAAAWLATLNLKGVGVEAISIDGSDSKDFAVHKILLGKNMIIIENLTNLDVIKSKYFILSVLPLKTVDADGSPVRAVAMEV